MRAILAALALILLTLQPALAAKEATRLKVRDAAAALVRGDAQTAIRNYTLALEDDTLANDRRATILNDRGVAYVRVGLTREAIEDYNKAVELFPEYAAVYNNRGNLLLALGLVDESIKDFDRAIALAPGYAAAYNNRAGALMRAGKTQAAIHDFTRAVSLMPSSAAPLSGRGRAHLELGRPHAAIRDFSRAVGANERFASAYRNRAEAKLEVADYNQAIEDLSRAIAFDVANPELYVLRGHAYLAAGDMQAATTDFTRVVELTPNSTICFEARGLAFAMAQNIEAALADLNRAISLSNRSATAFAYRAYAYVRNGQPSIAAQDIRNARKLDAKNAEVLWAEAELEDASGRPDKAIGLLQSALKIKPGFKRAVDMLARLGVRETILADVPVLGLGFEEWQVVQNGGAFYATNARLPKIRVPMEMMGEGKPRILGWEEKEAPFKQIGILRFHVGAVPGRNGKPEEIEQAAIIDLRSQSIVAVQPDRQGPKKAKWTWQENGRVQVAAVDGVTDEFALRQIAPRTPVTSSRKRRRGRGDEWGGPAWAPWNNDPWASNHNKKRKKRRSRRRKKPKTIFDLLFN